MRATGVARGIKGVLPYIRHVAPHCLVPVQVQDLAHARIAIDATLLVQRFFYRDSPDPYRYLGGFRDVIEQLRAVHIKPIFVFDHLHERLPQKARENARRRAAHRLASARYEHEQRRAKRLQTLCEHMSMFQQLSTEDQAHTCALLRHYTYSDHAASPPPLVASDDMNMAATWAQQHLAWTDIQDAHVFQLFPHPMPSDDAYDPFPHDLYVAVDGPPAAAALPWAVSDHACGDTPMVWELELPTPSATPQALAHALHAQRAALRAAQSSDVQETPAQGRTTDAEACLYKILGEGHIQGQGQLTCDAPRWNALCQDLSKYASPFPPISEDEALDVYAAAMHLLAISTQLVGMYRRSSFLIPQQAYIECMQLCRDMHAPVLVAGDDTPIHEGEALASALVREGYADMVASEDTDVLLYEVPMLRGLSNMSLELVDPVAIQAALFPHIPLDQRASSLIQFALLCGTDYNRTIPGIAVKNGHRLVN
ncbi:hypothetical protein MNAN1_002110, partial [Malassezia nana]